MQSERLSSLRGIAASSVSLQQLLSTCNSPSFSDSDICSWETWRERAFLQFGVPYEYFDLARMTLSVPDTGQPSDLGIPPRNISGSYRYLEIATKFQLIPESAAALNKRTATVSGIYESYAGIEQALKRNEVEAIDIFFPRLRPSQIESLIEEIENHSIRVPKYRFAALGRLIDLLFGNEAYRVLEEEFDNHIYQPSAWQISVEEAEKNKSDDGSQMIRGADGENEEEFYEGLWYLVSQGCRFALTQYIQIEFQQLDTARRSPRPVLRSLTSRVQNRDKDFLLATFRSGQVDMVDRMLSFLPSIQAALGVSSVAQAVTLRPFRAVTYEEGLIDRPPSSAATSNIPDSYFDAACYGGNPLLVDFLLSLKSDPDYRPSAAPIIEGYFTRRDPVGYYQVLQRCDPGTLRNVVKVGDIDLDQYISAQAGNYFIGWKNLDFRIIRTSVGNVDILLTYLPRYQAYMKSQPENERRGQTGKPAIVYTANPALYPLSSLLLNAAYSGS